MERSGKEWYSQIGIPVTEQPVGDFHPQGIGAFITALCFEKS